MPPTRHSLGKPLPYQQADRPQIDPKAIAKLSLSHTTFEVRELSGISPTFAGLYLSLGFVIYVLLTRSPLSPEGERSTCMPYPHRQRSS